MASITVISVYLASETSFADISDVQDGRERELIME
jgi:hypothetical protein